MNEDTVSEPGISTPVPDTVEQPGEKAAPRPARKRAGRRKSSGDSSQPVLFSTDGSASSEVPPGIEEKARRAGDGDPVADSDTAPASTSEGTTRSEDGDSAPAGEGGASDDASRAGSDSRGGGRHDGGRHGRGPKGSNKGGGGGHGQHGRGDSGPNGAPRPADSGSRPQDGGPRSQDGGGKRNKKRKRDKRGGGGGGGGSSDPRLRVDGLLLDTDPWLEIGELPSAPEFETLEGLETARTSGDPSLEPIAFNLYYDAPYRELLERFSGLGIELEAAPSRPRILAAILRRAREEGRLLRVRGTLELVDDGFGFLTYGVDNFRVRATSVFVPEKLIESTALRRGHEVEVLALPPRDTESCPVAVALESCFGEPVASVGHLVPFTELVPYYPTRRILLERPESEKGWDNLSMRVVDLITPIGFGQRGLIVAPPRTGKTVLLQNIANSIKKNYPLAHLTILLIDERPEEVTDFQRRVDAEVVSSTFDESADSHVHAAEMVIERSRAMVEAGRDVVILLDSITRLARAYTTMMPNSGKILSGGVEASALQKPKRFFGSARNIEQGGSLTIIATALVETGSRMDEVIFEEFKGTGNMELHLDRGLVDKRIFPAISMDRSGTRKEELLYHPDEMNKVYGLRRAMRGIPPTEAMELLIQRMKKTQTNAEFLMTLNR